MKYPSGCDCDKSLVASPSGLLNPDPDIAGIGVSFKSGLFFRRGITLFVVFRRELIEQIAGPHRLDAPCVDSLHLDCDLLPLCGRCIR